jgi:hypothetical protein
VERKKYQDIQGQMMISLMLETSGFGYTVKPGYKHIGDKHILTNKHAAISPKRICMGYKHNLNFKHMLMIGRSRIKINTKTSLT